MAAVTSSSTRAPIYKAFARRENIGDVTAKGECISNIADLVNTFLAFSGSLCLFQGITAEGILFSGSYFCYFFKL